MKKRSRGTCSCCGEAMLEYGHTMSAILVRALKVSYNAAGTEAFMVGEINMKHSLQANFQKLRYWGLVEMVPDAEGKKKRGLWRVTKNGEDFLKGRIKVLHRIWTYKAEVQKADPDTDGPLLSVFEVMPEYRIPEDWAQEARQALDPQQLELVKRTGEVPEIKIQNGMCYGSCNGIIWKKVA